MDKIQVYTMFIIITDSLLAITVSALTDKSTPLLSNLVNLGIMLPLFGRVFGWW